MGEKSTMVRQRSGIAKVIVVVILAALVGAAFMIMTQEQKVRTACEQVHATLSDIIVAGDSLTPEQVHKMINRQPHEVRKPGRHRLVEEYRWKGPFSTHTVYAYYTTAATQLLEAVSLNQKMDDWEGDDK